MDLYLKEPSETVRSLDDYTAKKEEYGEVIYKDGSKLRGYWQNDKKQGVFLKIDPNTGQASKEQWSNDVQIYDCNNPFLTLI